MAAHWLDWQHVRPRLVDDTAVTPEMERSLNLVLIGGPDENAVSRRIVPRLPLRVTPTSVTIDGRSFAARDAVVDLIYPSPLAGDRQVMIVAPTSAAGMRLWNPTVYWHALLGFRTSFYDWTLRDAPPVRPGSGPGRRSRLDRVGGVRPELAARRPLDVPRRRSGGSTMSLTRRSFLERLGAVGGFSAVYLGMEAMGLLNAPARLGRAVRAAARLGPRPQGRHPRRRHRRPGLGLRARAAPAGTSPCSRRATGRRPGLDRPRRRPDRPDRPARPALRLLRRPLSQCRRRPDPDRAPRHPRLCPPARRADRGHGQFQPRREMGLRRPHLHRPPDPATTCAVASPSCSPRRSTAARSTRS